MHKYTISTSVHVDVWAESATDAADAAADKLEAVEDVHLIDIHGYKQEFIKD